MDRAALPGFLAEALLGTAFAGLKASAVQTDSDDVIVLAEPGGRRRLLVKLQQSYLSAAEFTMHNRFHFHIAANGGPVVEPIALGGEAILTADDGRLAEIQAFFDGRAPDPMSDADLGLAGAVLAAFQRAAAGFVEPTEHLQPRARFEKCDFYRTIAVHAGLPASLVDALYLRLDRARDEVSDQRRSMTTEPCLQQTTLHGDVALDNILIGPGERAVLIDLDDAHLGPPIADIAWLVALTAGYRSVPGVADGYEALEAWDREAMSAVIAGYAPDAEDRAVLRRVIAPWLVASLVCGFTDCFLATGAAIDVKLVTESCIRTINIIDSMDEALDG